MTDTFTDLLASRDIGRALRIMAGNLPDDAEIEWEDDRVNRYIRDETRAEREYRGPYQGRD